MRRIVPLLSALVLASSLAPAGPVRGEPTLVEVRVAPDGTRRTNVVRAGAHAGVIETRDRGRLVRTRIVDPAEAVRCIVAFRSLPAQLALRHGLRATQAQTDVEHLRADLATMTAAPRRAGALTASAVITAEYTEVFAGAAVTLSPSLLARVRSLAYVSGVFPDDTVRATLAQSVPLIGADSVRAQLGADGTGIRVGIIDTGIDYAHAAFGANGVGPGHKIAWGHDYTTDGNDGSDNFGHGTHVAGIVAGDGGGVVGVAPGASLYSFKVLNAAGYGLTSWILAAFDAVLDPDGDPGTDDGMQVVNMSFGAPGGTSNDPLAVAVDHLTELGVACAVAAGNDGVWMSIGSPGTSRRAITVGATTKADAMTWFSSRGPVSNDFDLKPDVCAPGADIVSSAMGGGTVSLSGTSMATPHIAGVAALLRQRHPDWSADAVKGAIVGTALDIGAGELEQGSGRVLAMRAAQAKFVTSPTHLAFGMCDPSLPVWAASETLTVTNLTETATTVTWPDSVVLATGAVVRVSPSSAPLPAHGTATAVATLRVDNAVAPYPAQLPYAHTATLDVHAAGETHRVPASFHKAATLTVASSGWIYQLNVIEHASGQLVYSDFGGGPILLPPGDYDVMASFFPDWVFVTHENVHVSGATLETLDPTEATVTVTWDNVDAAGQPVTCTESKFTYGFGAGTGMNFVGFTVPSLSSNPTLPGCGLQWEQAATDAQNFRIVFNGTVTSFDHSRLLTNAPSDLHHMPIDFPATAHDSTTMMFFPLEDDGMGGWMGFGFLYNGLGHHGAWTLDEWVTAPPTVGHYSLGQWIELYGYAAGGAPDLMVDWPTLYTAYVMYDHGWPFQLLGTGHPFETFGTFGGDRMRLGTGMPVWRGRFHNTPGSIEFDQHPEVNLLHAEYDAYATWLPVPDPQYEVMQGGTTIDAGTLTGMGDLTTFGPYSVGLPTAAATDVVVTREYTLRGRAATLRVDAHALVGEGDPDPPVLQAMQLLANGTVADSVDFATAPGASLHFRFGDDVALASVAASVRPTGSATWQALTPVTNGADRTVTLPSSLAGPVDVRLEALDATGNSIALTWSPGFVARPGSATEVEDDAPVAPQAFSLAGAIRNPARGDALAIAFTLPDAAPARLALYDLSGREVRAFDVGSRGAGAHVAELGHGSPLASGVYFARLTRDGRSLTRKVCVL